MAITTGRANLAVAHAKAGSRANNALPSAHSAFARGQLALQLPQPVASGSQHGSGSGRLEVQAFKFMKQLGLKKPAFLPDFGKEKRVAALEQFYTSFDEATLSNVIADDFEYTIVGQDVKHNKQEWIHMLSKTVLPSIPDYNWTHATDGTKDDEDYCIVTVQATGHHTGKPFELPGYPQVPTSNKRFKLEQETHKVKVEDGKIKQLVVLPSKGAGPVALYKALGGKVPSSTSA